jgi:gamma-glutamylcyclotransferase
VSHNQAVNYTGGYVKYFAYGSNMSLVRLQERVPSAELLSVCKLKEHQLRFHKGSKDGSGKCDTFKTDNEFDAVIGALFEINHDEKPALDKAEGLTYGYAEKLVTVINNTGDECEALTYYATKIDDTLKPYSWYLNHVVIGTSEIEVPVQYLEMLKATESIDDTDKSRDSEQRAMYS